MWIYCRVRNSILDLGGIKVSSIKQLKINSLKRLRIALILTVITAIICFILSPAIAMTVSGEDVDFTYAYNLKIWAYPLLYFALSIIIYNSIKNKPIAIISSWKTVVYCISQVFRWIIGLCFLAAVILAIIYRANSKVVKSNITYEIFEWLLVLLTYISITRLLLCSFSIYKEKFDTYNNPPQRKEKFNCLWCSVLLLIMFWFVDYFMCIFETKSGFSALTWVSVLSRVASHDDFSFNNGFNINQPSLKTIAIASQNFIKYHKSFIVISIIPLFALLLSYLKDYFMVFVFSIKDIGENVEIEGSKGLKKLKKWHDSLPTKGYCLTCQRNSILIPMVTYDSNSLKIEESDIIQDAQIEQAEFLANRSLMNIDEYDIKQTFIKPDVMPIKSKTGNLVNPNWCCEKCKMTVYEKLTKMQASQKVINIKLIGRRNTAKTCFCASVFKRHKDLLLKGTPEYAYFKKFLDGIERNKAPGSTPEGMLASPVLAIDYKGLILGITDVAGENYEQAAGQIYDNDVVVIMLNLSENDIAIQSISDANNILALLPRKVKSIVICITCCDALDYFNNINDIMNLSDLTKSTRFGTAYLTEDELIKEKTNKFLKLFKTENPDVCKLFNDAQKIASSVEIVAHAALGTSVAEYSQELEYEYNPMFIDETLDTFVTSYTNSDN